MAAIAVLAVVLAIARTDPGLILFAGPFAGALLDRRAGPEREVLGGVIGGAITSWVAGVLFLVLKMYQEGYRSAMPMMAARSLVPDPSC